MPCPLHPHWFILIILGEECMLWSSSLCSFLEIPITSSLFGPNIPSIPCSQTPSVCFLLSVRKEQVQ
jgi:hypothetical protein